MHSFILLMRTNCRVFNVGVVVCTHSCTDSSVIAAEAAAECCHCCYVTELFGVWAFVVSGVWTLCTRDPVIIPPFLYTLHSSGNNSCSTHNYFSSFFPSFLPSCVVVLEQGSGWYFILLLLGTWYFFSFLLVFPYLTSFPPSLFSSLHPSFLHWLLYCSLLQYYYCTTLLLLLHHWCLLSLWGFVLLVFTFAIRYKYQVLLALSSPSLILFWLHEACNVMWRVNAYVGLFCFSLLLNSFSRFLRKKWPARAAQLTCHHFHLQGPSHRLSIQIYMARGEN